MWSQSLVPYIILIRQEQHTHTRASMNIYLYDALHIHINNLKLRIHPKIKSKLGFQLSTKMVKCQGLNKKLFSKSNLILHSFKKPSIFTPFLKSNKYCFERKDIMMIKMFVFMNAFH
jgi:hypothetical protein